MIRTARRIIGGALALAAAVSFAPRADAQAPTQAQQQAIRGACRADYQANCASVPPGGQASLQCLVQNRSRLTPNCAAAVAPFAPKAPAAAAPAPAPQAAAPAAADPHWPHDYARDGARLTVYEPQAISWPGRALLNARAAVAVTRQGAAQPVLGTIEVALATRVDPATQQVILSDPKLTASHFPTLDTAAAAQVQQRIAEALPEMQTKSLPLRTLMLGLKESEAPPPAIDNTPPRIFHSERPAIVLLFDGPPVLVPVPGGDLKVAVNANWDVVFDGSSNTWLLLDGDGWFAAPASGGPWAPAQHLPAAFSHLPADAAFAAIRAAVPGKPIPPAEAPAVFVSETPAEAIVTAGPPAFTPVPIPGGSALEFATNTASTLIRDRSSGTLYYLSSGRWFSAASLDGPWTFATPNLPPDFQRIPQSGALAHVPTSVPGTPQAQLAVLQAQVPQQATLRRATATFTAEYAGPPQFRPIGETGVAYAVNSAVPVLETGGRYYACTDGAWFVASSPNGPWTLAEALPPAIATIPPSSPVYPVTAVQVYGATPEAVTYGYTAGYLLGFATAGALVYGTGYYYPPVVLPGAVPVYYGYPRTYAGGVYYNPATGAWARGGTVYGPYGRGATGGAYYNPSTGAYARGGAVYGPYGGASAWSAYNPRTGAYAHGSATWGGGYGTAYASGYNPATGRSGSTTQNVSPYGRWGSSQVSGPNRTVNTESGRNGAGAAGAFQSSTGASGAAVHGNNGRNAGVVQGAGGNVYAGADGNVYRHTDQGWSKWNNGWNPVTPPSRNGTGRTPQAGGYGGRQYAPSPQLEQDRFAREGGGYSGGFQRGGRFGR